MTGYLGSGKTTLLNQVLSNQKGYKVAVIVNDIGEVNIDASLIQKGGNVTQKDENLVPLSNGCICCTLKVDLMKQIISLAQSKKFDYILIEASGICEPGPIAGSICMLDGTDETVNLPAVAYLDNITTVVDAKRMADEFGCGDALLNENMDEEDIENLLVQQIEYCTTIVLNKTDLVTDEEKKNVISVIKALQPKAKIIETTYGNVDVDDILSTGRFDYEKFLKVQAGFRLCRVRAKIPRIMMSTRNIITGMTTMTTSTNTIMMNTKSMSITDTIITIITTMRAKQRNTVSELLFIKM